MSSSSVEKASNVHFHAEIGLLKKALVDKQAELNAMRSACYQETDRRGEIEDVVLAWQDKFERLYDSHKKVQKINQTLEDKLLKLVDRNSFERAQLTSDCATLNIRLSQANSSISSLQREIERYKQDIHLAIQLLHCKSDNFLPQKVNSLPLEMQSKIASYMKLDASESIGNLTKGKYQILPTNEDETFTPNLSKNGEMKVSPVVVAKFLENELKSKKHCETCLCAKRHLTEVEGIQTTFNIGIQTDVSTFHCLRCNLNSPSQTNSPYLIQLKSSDSVISTKSSVSDFTHHHDKSFTPSKVDDLKVNPILGHHRLCEHTKNFNFQPKSAESIKGLDPLPVKAAENNNLRNWEKVGDVKTSVDEKVLSHGAGNGSNSSLWSKTSSKEGAKLFENFNRNLIKAMRAENPRKIAPRICALKFQNGTNNIVLDSPQGEAKTYYTRRSRLLDEELLDEEKDISGNVPMNFESSQSSMVLSTASNQSNLNHEIFSTNKTDSEKFNEIQSKDVLVPLESSPVVIKIERDLNINIGKIARSPEIFCEGSELEVHNNMLLRRQQLTRVAEWVQNSSNVPLPNSPMQKLDNLNSFLSLDYENNNSNSRALLNQMYKESFEKNAQNNLTEQLNVELKSLSIKSGDEKIDLAQMEQLQQMEYNVKKFLLKQNEWNHSVSGDSDAASKSQCNEETVFSQNSTEKSINFLVQRTETNL